MKDFSETGSFGNVLSNSSIVESKKLFVLRGYNQNNKERKLIQKTSQSLINYFYRKKFNDQEVCIKFDFKLTEFFILFFAYQLCYLLGPGRKFITENDQCKILPFLPSGYCQLMSVEQGKDIEKELYSILPQEINIQNVTFHNNLSLLICSSAAESIFEQSIPCLNLYFIEIILNITLDQTYYAIITEQIKVHSRLISLLSN